MRLLLSLLSLLLLIPLKAQATQDPVPASPVVQPSADAVLAQVDQNLTFELRRSVATMTVVKPKRTKVYEFISYGRGANEGATEFVSPARDAGTRMLKKGDELWMYLPSVEKVQKLSGHMLRQGLMGSDVSYEDLLESSGWQGVYSAEMMGAETLDGRPCWVLELTAKDPSVSYPKRKVWVDQEWSLPVKQELYAVSGMLLKVWTMSEPQQQGQRWVPMKMVVEEQLKAGTRTEVVFGEVSFDVELEGEVFSTRWLER